jgi:hypothetical protein
LRADDGSVQCDGYGRMQQELWSLYLERVVDHQRHLYGRTQMVTGVCDCNCAASGRFRQAPLTNV